MANKNVHRSGYTMLRGVQTRAQTDQKVYAECLNETGSKRFFAATNSSMWTKMQQQPRHYSEVIRDAPCHMFFDFDEGDVHLHWKTLEPILNKLLEAHSLEYTHVVLDSSQGEKQSLHVITRCNEFLLSCPSDGKRFLHKLEPFYDISVIDSLIYNSNRCFRMLGSSKFGGNRPFRGTWSRQFWESSLVQPLDDLPHRTWGPVIPRSIKSTSEQPQCVRRAVKFLNAEYSFKYAFTWRYSGNLKKGICPFAGRQHRSNNMYFVLQLGYPAKISCHRCQKELKKKLPPDIQRDINTFLQQLV